MELEVWNRPRKVNTAGGSFGPFDNWHCHIRGGGNITFTASGYDSKSIAITALCNHMIACEAFLHGTSVKAVPKERKQEIRAMVRARVKVLA